VLLAASAVVAVADIAATLLPAAAAIAGSDCIHDAGELRFWSVGWMYQEHFLQADYRYRSATKLSARRKWRPGSAVVTALKHAAAMLGAGLI
jgi:hypothetical protein